MVQQWRLMSFLHWRYPADAVARLLPSGLAVETYDGSAWVGLLPFEMRGVRPPGVPPLPWLSRFAETNVRTYVRGPDGGSGIYFFTLEAARLPAVVAARAALALPYRWARMTVALDGDRLVYRAARRWPAPAGAGYDIEIRVGRALPDPGPLARFLTERYLLYTLVGARLVRVGVRHPTWDLHAGEAVRLRSDLLPALGLPAPVGDPLVHTSPGVVARIARPRRVPA
jgi:uncharacterized protein